VFELGKTLKENKWNHEKKWYKRIAREVYKNFGVTYLLDAI